MHLFLTDRTICPRCGPGFGLILLAHEVLDRRVFEGDLGCSNCREQYPVRAGFADLRPPPRTSLVQTQSDTSSEPVELEETVRLGALLGVTEGPGTLLIKGPKARFAQAITDLIGGVEVVAEGLDLLPAAETEGVSRLLAGRRIPFMSDTFRAVLMSGEIGSSDLDEAARVVGHGGRVVVLDAPRGKSGQLEALGFTILLEEGGVLVGRSEASPSLPLIPLRGL